MSSLDKAQWQRLSPMLDTLLDLTEPARSAQLAALRAREPELADELQALLAPLADEPVLDDFLEGVAWPSQAERAGHRVGAYELERELGQGGMGSVWLAHRTDGRYEGQVAIKFLHTGLLGRGDAGRFAREGRILARLDHPHIARLLDAGVSPEEDQPYLVLEYIQGQPLDRYCDEHALNLPARLQLFLDVLAAVTHAHNQLILHRDLKPSNILVTTGGQVKLLDFGIAKLLDNTQLGGDADLTRAAGQAYTLAYAAPEQVQDGEVSTATDVYALGVLLYQLLGGSHPTSSRTAGHTASGRTKTELDKMRALVELTPQRLSDNVLRQGGPDAARRARALRGDLDTLVAKALKKQPRERYANATELADDLRRHLANEPLAAQPDTLAYRSAKFLRRHRLGVALGTVMALTLSGAAGVALHQARQAQQQRAQAQQQREQAEGLIEFMLGDLRQKLQAVGRLDVLDAVGDKALAHYAAQDLASLDANALGRRARALHLMGEIAEQRGQQAQAAQRFKDAAASTAALLARDPNDPQRVFDQAQSEYWLGYIAYQRRQLTEAEAGFTRYLELAQRLVQMAPGKREWRVEVASATQNLGVVYIDQRRLDVALSHLNEARQRLALEAPEQPSLYFDLANALGWIAVVLDAQGNFEQAIATQREKIAALAKVPDADHDRDIQGLLAIAHQLTARSWLNLGEKESAAAELAKAMRATNELVALDSTNKAWLHHQGLTALEAADLAWWRGRRAEATRLLSKAEASSHLWLSSNDGNIRQRINLEGGRLIVAARLAGSDQSAAIVDELKTYLQRVTRDVAAGAELDLAPSLKVAEAALMCGDFQLQAQQPEAASNAWHFGLSTLQSLGAASGPAALALQAHIMLRLGQVQEARALAETVQASRYRHPLYAELRQRLTSVPLKRAGE